MKCTDNSGFADAIKAASSSDFVVYVGGISHDIEGEGNDRSNITIPGYQTDLILGYICAIRCNSYIVMSQINIKIA